MMLSWHYLFARRTKVNKKRLIVFPDDIVLRLLIESRALGYTDVSPKMLKEAVYGLSLRLPAIAKMFRFRVDPMGKDSEPFDQAISNLISSQLIFRTSFGTTEMIAVRSTDCKTVLPRGMVAEIKYAARIVKAVTK